MNQRTLITTLITIEIIIAALVMVFIIGTYLSSGFYYDAMIWIFLTVLASGALYGLKKHNTTKVRRAVAITAILCFCLSFAELLGDVPVLPETPAMGFTISIILVLLDWRMKRQDGESGLQDERSLRIGTYGIACSWYITYFIVIFLMVSVGIGGMQIPVEMVLLVLIIIMPISTILFQHYYNRKGDVY